MNKLTAIFLLSACIAQCQTEEHLKIVDRFKIAVNDSIFVLTYSDLKEFSYKIDTWLQRRLSYVDSVVFHATVLDVVGPFETDTHFVWLKVQRADSSLKMRAGNIWVNYKSIGWDGAHAKAKSILEKAVKGESFDALCKQYSEDGNKKYDCDLGWFWDGAMVKEFSTEIKKHKKGDLFIVKTTYGWHVVKVLDDFTKDKISVKATPLYIKK